jgi:hypothetical protein
MSGQIPKAPSAEAPALFAPRIFRPDFYGHFGFVADWLAALATPLPLIPPVSLLKFLCADKAAGAAAAITMSTVARASRRADIGSSSWFVFAIAYRTKDRRAMAAPMAIYRTLMGLPAWPT